MQIWTYRDIHAKPDNRFKSVDFDTFLEAFAESFWDESNFSFITQRIGVGSVNKTIHLTSWPSWIPKRVALWYATRKLSEHGFSGDIYFVTGRTVMK